MEETTGPPSYEKLQHTFKAVLGHALHEGELPPACLIFELTVVQTLGDVARAARDGSPTREIVSEACTAFANYVTQQHATQRGTPLGTVALASSPE